MPNVKWTGILRYPFGPLQIAAPPTPILSASHTSLLSCSRSRRCREEPPKFPRKAAQARLGSALVRSSLRNGNPILCLSSALRNPRIAGVVVTPRQCWPFVRQEPHHVRDGPTIPAYGPDFQSAEAGSITPCCLVPAAGDHPRLEGEAGSLQDPHRAQDRALPRHVRTAASPKPITPPHPPQSVRAPPTPDHGLPAHTPAIPPHHCIFVQQQYPAMDLQNKLAILADAAKYDASCASSGTDKRSSIGGRGIGSTEGSGICHSYTPDGRCISLLKILLTNYCTYDCLLLRQSRQQQRAARAVQRRRGGAAHARLLPPQLHRRAVSQLGDHPQRRLHDGAGGGGGAACCARITTFAATST